MITEQIHWLGHASFRIEDQDKQIYIDPWKIPAGLPPADFIFITHAHHDHCSPQDVARLAHEQTFFIGTVDVLQKIQKDGVVVKPGESKTVGGLSFTTIAAYNIEKSFHPKSNGWVGYVIKFSDGKSVYHTGDSDFIPEMQSVKTDFLLISIGGTYTMNAIEAARACEVIQPEVVFPMHWGDIVGTLNDVEVLKKNTKIPVHIQIEKS